MFQIQRLNYLERWSCALIRLSDGEDLHTYQSNWGENGTKKINGFMMFSFKYTLNSHEYRLRYYSKCN